MNAPVAIPPPDDGLARIGPGSVLELVPLMDDVLGEAERDRLLMISGMPELPPDQGMMAETPAATLHQALRADHPTLAPALTIRAGERTADHIIARRIPKAALQVMHHLPPWLSAPLLASVIAKHAWTFAGSGKFKVLSKQPLVFALTDNPVVRGEHSEEPICDWHSAVFQRLFSSIVDPNLRCVETHCCASGSKSCIFEIR
ncbi:bacteriochlorophyll 4-vinyl reductase [Congregibacter variabilis]|uniref:Bacteriochlorophyll 4-vinyl reductase n=1 Tax=Congregibacter variabilis TaxID=3081200 RepID=A0ABZ0I5Y5_9GAMM|nr:bacteriochlorophyll 4-vinyl reductase [Congregibacter sp. IMCC43200]